MTHKLFLETVEKISDLVLFLEKKKNHDFQSLYMVILNHYPWFKSLLLN